MNILPKKSWHVLNKQNIERVRRDEARAKAEEEEKAGRASRAEQEARLGAMRKRARARDGMEEEDSELERETAKKDKDECSVTDSSGHINFFADLQKGVGMQVGNTEREKEMKQEQEKLEKRIGLLNYLVDKDKSDSVPWYVRGKGKGPAARAEEAEARRKSAKAQLRKELQDPLLQMQGFLDTKRKKQELDMGVAGGMATRGGVAERLTQHQQLERQSSSKTREHTESDQHRGKKDVKKKKKEKKKKKKEKERRGERGRREEEGESDLERLRRERRKREEGERVRSEALIRGLEGGGGNESSEPQADSRRYNSQFNPHLARQH